MKLGSGSRDDGLDETQWGSSIFINNLLIIEGSIYFTLSPFTSAKAIISTQTCLYIDIYNEWTKQKNI